MVKKLVQINLNFIKNNTEINDIYELDKIRYGLEVFFNDLLKFIVIFLISFYLNKSFAFLIITFLFLGIRIFIGGSHRKTVMGCLIHSTCLYLATYYLANIFPNSIKINIIIIIIALILILKYDPINRHRKKTATFLKKSNQKYIALLNICVWCLVSNFLLPTYLVNCGTIIIIYILFDFYLEVKLDEKI